MHIHGLVPEVECWGLGWCFPQSRHKKAVVLKAPARKIKTGANDRNRTDDLFITSELLYRLSYIGPGMSIVYLRI